MKKLNFLLVAFVILVANVLHAQRYLTPQFTKVNISAPVTYGVNQTVLYYSVYGQAIPQPLKAEVYTPDGDKSTLRPLVICFHTGNFLPFNDPSDPTKLGFNGSCSGTIKDSAVVEVANRLAKLGYVAAVAEYRYGWNPLATSEEERRSQLIGAAYRGIQDARTAIRFFKKSVKENNNPYGIDTSKIVLWGQGTGGYLSFGAGVLNDPKGLLISKFIKTTGTTPTPMIIPQINGDINGASWGVVPAGALGAGSKADTLCSPSNLGYSSNFQLSVNCGGAVGDTSWIDKKSIPMISFHVPLDPYTPYYEGIVIVPGSKQSVVTVQGSYLAQYKAQSLGNQALIISVTDKYTPNQTAAFQAAPDPKWKNTMYGLYPFNRVASDSAPWEWTSVANPNPAQGVTNCNTDAVKARAVIDTIMGFFAPRAFKQLNLTLAVNEVLSAQEVGMKMYPNPANSEITFETASEKLMRDIDIYDINGRLVASYSKINNNYFQINRNNLPSGVYIVQILFDKGVVPQKLMLTPKE